jgi:hypothetical protein
MDPLVFNRWKKVSFGVVDFTADRMNPKVFLHKEDIAWRMGSTGKIAILLAAAQLRDDVRNVKALPGLVMSPTEFDHVFATIWARSANPDVIAITKGGAPPRISTTIDVSKSDPDFIVANVPPDTSLRRTDNSKEPPWPKMTPLSFRNRLWLAGAWSDNIAATACISEIGLAYIKAVQRAYGLFVNHPKNLGMRMLLSGAYRGVDTTTPVLKGTVAPTYRDIRNTEYLEVEDKLVDSAGKVQPSTQSGSVAALTAYMIALIQDKLVNKAGCEAIKSFLANERPNTSPGSLVRGVDDIAKIDKAHAKGGALNKADGAVQPLRCDVAYIESAGKKYAIVAQGLLPFNDGVFEATADEQGTDLAKRIHRALIAP